MKTTNALFEVGLEEMPAQYLAETERQLNDKTKEWLEENRLTFNSLETFITPRRFAVLIHELASKQTDLEEEKRGPAEKIALDKDGNWTKAALGFCKGQGADINDLYIKEVNGTNYVFVKKFTAGKDADVVLPTFKDVILKMNFPKNMKWSNRSLRYIRPIKWLLAVNEERIIPFEIEGIKTSNKTRGHRFLGDQVEINNPLEYELKLNEQYVIASSKKRKQTILDQLNALIEKHQWQIDLDEDLLEEVTQLVEYPTAFYGEFNADYLVIPEEALITSMKVHQRYFSVRDESGALLPYFISVRNGNSDYIENVVKGNEKVLNARLADGLFFYQEDLKKSIEENNEKLSRMVFQEQLGTLADKVKRVTKSASQLSERLNLTNLEQKQVERAATISKFDLVTQMVDEFPNLQGIMGEQYAERFGEDKVVAKAINEHYMPRHANDDLPSSEIGAILSVAEKMDTIVGCIAIGLIPSGSQDPYALRRQAMGVIQILKSFKWNISLEDIVDLQLQQYVDSSVEINSAYKVKEHVLQFIEGRIVYLAREDNIAHDVIKAVSHAEIGVISDIFEKAKLLETKRQDDEFKEVHEALGRVLNIANEGIEAGINIDLFENHSEELLYTSYQSIKDHYNASIKNSQFEEALKHLELLTPAIGQFFEQTMVMVDDLAVRENRISLLNEVAELINKFADFNKVEWKQHF